jgi:hypothetical protein
VAIVSNNVILTEGKNSTQQLYKRRHGKIMMEPLIKYKFPIKCSGATLEKRKRSRKKKIEVA